MNINVEKDEELPLFLVSFSSSSLYLTWKINSNQWKVTSLNCSTIHFLRALLCSLASGVCIDIFTHMRYMLTSIIIIFDKQEITTTTTTTKTENVEKREW